MYVSAVDNSGLRIPAMGVSFNTSDGENARFARLEEVILSKGTGSQPSSFKPTIQCYTHTTNNAASPVIAAEGTLFLVSICVHVNVAHL